MFFQIWSEQVFPTRRDSATFRDKQTEAPLFSQGKGTTGQAQNLAKGRDGPGQPNLGWDWLGQPKYMTGGKKKRGRAEI